MRGVSRQNSSFNPGHEPPGHYLVRAKRRDKRHLPNEKKFSIFPTINSETPSCHGLYDLQHAVSFQHRVMSLMLPHICSVDSSSMERWHIGILADKWRHSELVFLQTCLIGGLIFSSQAALRLWPNFMTFCATESLQKANSSAQLKVNSLLWRPGNFDLCTIDILQAVGFESFRKQSC